MTEAQAARVMALYDVMKRCGATADTMMSASLLDRLLTAATAGVSNVTDEEWTVVLQLFRVAEEAQA